MFEIITLKKHGDTFSFPIEKVDFDLASKVRRESNGYLDDDYKFRWQAMAKWNKEVKKNGVVDLHWGVKYEWLCSQNSNRYHRASTINKRIEYIVDNGQAVFGTLTFTDEVLKQTSFETRRQYVRKFLKANCSIYVANIDFGKNKEREHYHFVGSPFNRKIDKGSWRFGFDHYKSVKYGSPKTLARYVHKLSNHAVKDTAFFVNQNPIYSRNFVNVDDLPF